MGIVLTRKKERVRRGEVEWMEEGDEQLLKGVIWTQGKENTGSA